MQPKANDTGWVVVPNLWGGIIAPPGFMKSPVITATTRPLTRIQSEWLQDHKRALRDFALAKEECDLRHFLWKEKFKKNARKKALEKGLISVPITLLMPNGNTVTLRGGGDYALDLVARASRGDRTPEVVFVAQSVSSTEPGGGHLVDLARAILNSPMEDAQ